ncbi:hypothetical protein EK21DRAFT_91786 [Setomelanomma holmii]|uniref:Uncharacterized protein n=1 Tax=Setomelanomma holmii TaxID=210430 RepID=A0A9P4H3Y3_9PLEO|nr:hypothetical protein EK21DRAFT_91786 [Setomelanomma holmii]
MTFALEARRTSLKKSFYIGVRRSGLDWVRVGIEERRRNRHAIEGIWRSERRPKSELRFCAKRVDEIRAINYATRRCRSCRASFAIWSTNIFLNAGTIQVHFQDPSGGCNPSCVKCKEARRSDPYRHDDMKAVPVLMADRQLRSKAHMGPSRKELAELWVSKSIFAFDSCTHLPDFLNSKIQDVKPAPYEVIGHVEVLTEAAHFRGRHNELELLALRISHLRQSMNAL